MNHQVHSHCEASQGCEPQFPNHMLIKLLYLALENKIKRILNEKAEGAIAHVFFFPVLNIAYETVFLLGDVQSACSLSFLPF